MKYLIFLLLFSQNAYSHGGDDGPSSIESEFAKLSHLHLPVNFNTHEGLILGYEIGEHADETDTDTDSETDRDDSKHENESSVIEMNVHPVFFGGVDKINRYKCISKNNLETIKICHKNSPYLLLKNYKWDLGLGAELDFHLPITGVSSGIGLTYLIGRNYFSQNVLKHKLEKREKLKLPTNIHALSNWRIGDQLSFSTKGSLIISTFIGMEPIFHIGPEYIHTGIHKYNIKKTSDEIFVVDISTLKTDSIGVEGNGVILNAEASSGILKNTSYSFELNMKSPLSFDLIKLLMAGKIHKIQKMNESLKNVLKLQINSNGTALSVTGSIGIPLLYYNGASIGRYKTLNEVSENEVNEIHQHKLYTNTIFKERFTRGLLSKHKARSTSFLTNILIENEKENSILSTSIIESYNIDDVNQNKVQKTLNKLGEVYQIKKLENFQLKNKISGFFKFELNIGLNAKQIFYILNHYETSRDPDIIHLKNNIDQNYHQKKYLKMSQYINKLVHSFFKNKIELSKFLKINKPKKIELLLEGESIESTLIQL